MSLGSANPPYPGKFTYLEEASRLLEKERVPEFQYLPSSNEDLLSRGPCILRSALLNEGNLGSLNSGKSISIGGIRNTNDLTRALEIVNAQPQLKDCILQREIAWETHLTLWVNRDFFIGESRERGGKVGTFFSNPLTRSFDGPQAEPLRFMLDRLKPILEGHQHWILELGVQEGGLYLFQIQPVAAELFTRIFSSDVTLNLILSQKRFAKRIGLLGMIRTEWQAHRFRRSFQKGRLNGDSPSPAVFLNWEFLFHYFRLFCMISKARADAKLFSLFLSNLSHQNDHLSAVARKHLEIANALRKTESAPPIEAGFEMNTPQFIGKGRITGTLGEAILWQNEPELTSIYADPPPKVILCSSASLLSHPTLACAERGIGLVIGLSSQAPFLQKKGVQLIVDFNHREITLT